MTTVTHANGRSVVQSIHLSNDTVARRINMMATDVENSLCNILRTTEFSLQIDESTLPGNEALLLAYVRFIQEGKLVEEMLFARPLVTDSKAESIFKLVEYFFTENPQLIKDVQKAKFGVAYLLDIYDKFNAMNLQLQGSVVTLIKCKTVIWSFIGKLTLFDCTRPRYFFSFFLFFFPSFYFEDM